MNNSTGKQLKIIIVDDNTIFRKTIVRFLQEELQYKVIGEASGGEEFFTLSNIFNADIILMDLQMPEVDGYTITKRLLFEYNNIPVIAITMHTEIAYLQELILVGFKGCVFKPNFYKDVQEAIQTVLKKRFYFPKDLKL